MWLMEYKILYYDNVYDLEIKVKHYLSSGWEPLGGLTIRNAGPLRDYYYQTLVRNKECK